jgi:hypothetical protein
MLMISCALGIGSQVNGRSTMFIRFQLIAAELRGEMVRLTGGDGAGPEWSVRDNFAVDAKPSGV